jgi:pilus assembly protein CpaB
MNAKKILPLIAAVVMGLLAAKIVVHLVATNRETASSNAGPHVVTVVVTARDIEVGQIITDSDVEDGQLAAESAPSNSFKDPSIVIGRVAATSLMRGQAVLDSMLAPKGSGSGLQAVIPNGMRALTIEVNEVSGVAGYITPGCHVDIVQSLRDGPNGLPEARCIAQNVAVTAVGERHITDTNEEAHSVTLLVTPVQSETIELASTNGRPRLVLRGSRDQTQVNLDSVTLAELTGVSPSRFPNVEFPTKADPFAVPTSQPSPAPQQAIRAVPAEAPSYDQWLMRVVAAGEETVIRVNLPASSRGATVTGNGMEQTGDDQSP